MSEEIVILIAHWSFPHLKLPMLRSLLSPLTERPPVDELLDVISDLVSNTPPERIVQLAEKVRECFQSVGDLTTKLLGVNTRRYGKAQPLDNLVARVRNPC